MLDHCPNPPFLVLSPESPSLARVAITNAVPQAIDRLPREAWQNPPAIHASSEMGSGSTCEIRRSNSESLHGDGAAHPPTGSDRLDLLRTTLPESRQRTARWCLNPSLLPSTVLVPVRARFVRLQGVGQAIYEQCKISLCHFRARLAYAFHKVPLSKLAVTPSQVSQRPSGEAPDVPSTTRLYSVTRSSNSAAVRLSSRPSSKTTK